MNELLTLIISGILSGGIIGAGVSVYTARRKVPAERDSLIVTGAETAVSTLERTLAAETRRAERAEKRVGELEEALTRKDARIEALEARLDDLQQALNEAREELHRILSYEE